MKVYLVQHGEAVPEAQDPERPLSERGRAEVEAVARHMARHWKPAIHAIYHSGKLRARQTAEILAAHLKPAEGVRQAEGLKPLDDPADWQRRLTVRATPCMLVGHLPHLSRLCGLLLCGNAEQQPVAFRYGAVVELRQIEGGRWQLAGLLTPEMVAGA